MEGVAKGVKAAHGTCEGILVPAVFPHRQPTGNQYLSSHTDAHNLSERIAVLVERADVYVVLPGMTGAIDLCKMHTCNACHKSGNSMLGSVNLSKLPFFLFAKSLDISGSPSYRFLFWRFFLFFFLAFFRHSHRAVCGMERLICVSPVEQEGQASVRVGGPLEEDHHADQGHDCCGRQGSGKLALCRVC